MARRKDKDKYERELKKQKTTAFHQSIMNKAWLPNPFIAPYCPRNIKTTTAATNKQVNLNSLM